MTSNSLTLSSTEPVASADPGFGRGIEVTLATAPQLAPAIAQAGPAFAVGVANAPAFPLIHATAPFSALLGKTAAALAGESFPGLCEAIADPMTLARIGRALRRCERVTAEVVTRDADGVPTETALHVQPVTDADGRMTHFVVHAAHRAPMAAEEDDDRRLVEWVYENSDLAVAACDAAGRIQRVNGALCRLLGQAPDVLIGAQIGAYIAREADSREPGFDLDRLCAGGSWLLHQRDGSLRTALIKGGPLHPGRADSSICLTFSDVTARRQVEVALMRARDEAEVASRTKSSFLANMSHELRTPLNAIIGFSEIIESEFMGPLGEPRYLEYVGDIHRSAKHLLDIINNILDISKIEAGRLELHEESMEIGRAVDGCINLVRERAVRHGVTISVALDPGLPLLLADATKVKQIVLNLLSNAVKFTPEGGKVEIRGHQDESGALVIEIADTGIGMTREELQVAMEPFGQVDSDLGRRFEGTGLGLPLTKALVEVHGGTLSLESAPGAGTTARVRLPEDRSVLLPPFERPEPISR